MLSDDYEVPFLSQETIDAVGSRFAAAVFGASVWQPRVLARLLGCREALLNGKCIEIIEKSDDQMLGAQAYATANPPRIFVRKSVLTAAQRGDYDSEMTFLHEVGHLLLHSGAGAKARMVDGNATFKHIKEGCSAEEQAWKFARAARMPTCIIDEVSSAKELAARAGVPLYDAEKRWKEISGFSVIKRTPPEVAQFLASERARQQISPMEAAWLKALIIQDENPALFRETKNRFRIAKNEFNRCTGCGWLIENGEPVSFVDLQSR